MINLEFNAIENRTYNVELMETLDTGWVPVHVRVVTAKTNGPNRVAIPLPPGATTRYLRVRLTR